MCSVSSIHSLQLGQDFLDQRLPLEQDLFAQNLPPLDTITPLPQIHAQQVLSPSGQTKAIADEVIHAMLYTPTALENMVRETAELLFPKKSKDTSEAIVEETHQQLSEPTSPKEQ